VHDPDMNMLLVGTDGCN